MLLDTYRCLSQEHNPYITTVAIGVCLVSALCTFRLYGGAQAVTGRARIGWLVLVALVTGCGVWATHFVAMLAFDPGPAVGYRPTTTAVSMGLGIAGTGTGFVAATYLRNTPFRIACGVLIGLGVAVMHYTGMLAFEVAAFMSWKVANVGWSIALAAAFGGLAIWTAGDARDWASRIRGALAFSASIASLHFIGMGAITLVGSESAATPAWPVDTDNFVLIGVVGTTMLLMAVATAVALIDTSTRDMADDKTRYLALHDPLTGLLNRAGFAEVVRKALDGGDAGMLIVLDCDRFKDINDGYGHGAGDDALVHVSRALQALGPGISVARLGGDEFAVLVPGNADMTHVCARIATGVSEPFYFEGQELSMSASMGVAVYPTDAADHDALLQRADLALLRVKADGRGGHRRFEPEMDAVMVERRRLAQDLRRAVEAGDIQVHYQPQAVAASGEVTGFEALARWTHPERGAIPPSVFIPIAEETGLIRALGEAVMRRACADAAAWQVPLRIAVNVSPEQFRQGNLPALIEEILRDSNLEPARLEIEITESVFVRDPERALATVRAIKAMGVGVAMDDFGVGFSSLSTLHMFPFDTIKIDRTFVGSMGAGGKGIAIVRAVVGIAESLGVAVVAEGVETAWQMEQVTAERCGSIQGYLIGRPLPVEAWTHLTTRGTRRLVA